MSAFVVDKEHIDYLVHAALAVAATWRGQFGYYHDEQWHYVTGDNATETGRMLWRENMASVFYRYPDKDDDNSAGRYFRVNYTHETLMRYQCPGLRRKRFDPVVALKAIDCYDYQSCEHPGWKASPAYAFCDYLRGALIGLLPGYDDAPWEIDADTVIAAA